MLLFYLFLGLQLLHAGGFFFVFIAPQMKQNMAFVDRAFFFIFKEFFFHLFVPKWGKNPKPVEVTLKIFWFYILHTIGS